MAENILQTIAAHNRRLVAAAKLRVSEGELAERAQALSPGDPRAFERALCGPGLSLICEVKRASPSKGLIARDFSPVDIARTYEEAGADAISCLTEPRWFRGSLDHLREIAATVPVPVMRKDFVVDAYQLYEAKLAGAKAVLLLTAILDDGELARLMALAEELGLGTLVEVYSAEEVRRAVGVGARVIGVNNRDLRDFSVDFGNARRMRALIPSDAVYVAESGVGSLDDVATIARMGADAALVGEFLMRAEDKVSLLAQMRTVAGGEAR